MTAGSKRSSAPRGGAHFEETAGRPSSVYAVESVASPSAAAFALHDAKNMLGVVSANVDYLDQEIAGGERTPAIDAALADLRESADRLGDLLREAIVALRGPGVKKADAATTRVAPIISSVVARSRRRADAAGVRIDVHLQGDPGSLIARDLLERILDNLLDNALRHSKAGDVIELTCTANPEGGGVVSVTDEGPGVPVVAREAIFSAYRARGTPDAGHFGLGLAFCRAVARAYGGDVRVQDAPHAGARFVLELA